MKKFNQLFTLSTAIFAICLSRQNAAAQPNFGNGNFDMQQMIQQMQQRVIDNIHEQFAVTNDAEWRVIEPKLTKLVQATTDTTVSQMRNMMAGMRGGGGPGGMGGGMPDLGAPDPDAEALQKLLDDQAPTLQIKAALAKYRASVKRKAAELDKAKDDLRQVLTERQEAILTTMGIL